VTLPTTPETPGPGATPRGLLIDIDGVLAVSWRALRGAPGALVRLRQAGVPFQLVTNTTSRTRAAIAEALCATRVPVEVDEILSAPGATAAYLRTTYPGGRCLLLSSGSVREDLEGVPTATLAPDGTIAGTAGKRPTPTGLAAVVLGGAGPEFTYEALCAVFQLVLDGVPLVAMHRNRSWKTNEGLQLDSGAYLTAIEEATGVGATVLGKPEPAFFEAGLDKLGLPAAEVAMIGDDIHVDVLGAQAAGLTGVLVRTGKFRPERLERAERQPDVVLDSFADVPTWLGLT
jgi:HAD superfamily hydrolase (TIGR01458 family)